MQSGRLTRRCTIRERKENSEHFISRVEGDGSVSWCAETVWKQIIELTSQCV